MNLEPEFILLIKNSIKKYLPSANIFIFGSRARTTNRAFSDIDIAIKDPTINSDIIAQIKFELEESNLPYKFDVVNYDDLDELILTGAKEV